MQRIAIILVLVLSGYTAGTVVRSDRIPEAADLDGVLSPFLLIAVAILVASVGYAVSSVLRGTKLRRRRDEDS
jgi:hypothetical protein